MSCFVIVIYWHVCMILCFLLLFLFFFCLIVSIHCNHDVFFYVSIGRLLEIYVCEEESLFFLLCFCLILETKESINLDNRSTSSCVEIQCTASIKLGFNWDWKFCFFFFFSTLDLSYPNHHLQTKKYNLRLQRTFVC